MIGVIIGIGAWNELAWETARKSQKLTGVTFHVISESWRDVAHPSWLKLWVADRFPKEDAFLIMDADMIPIKPWRPESLLARDPRRLWAARDRLIPAVQRECTDHRLSAGLYANGGLLLFTRAGGGKLLEAARAAHPKCGRWLEQTAVNIEMQRDLTKSGFLPRAYNHVTSAQEIIADPRAFRHSVTLHTVALGGDLQKFHDARQVVRKIMP